MFSPYEQSVLRPFILDALIIALPLPLGKCVSEDNFFGTIVICFSSNMGDFSAGNLLNSR